MISIKKSYKITSFLNASFIENFKRESEYRANTFEIICYLSTNKKLVSLSDFENAIQSVITPLSGQNLNDLPRFKSKVFSIEVLAQFLAIKINEQLSKIDSKLEKIELAEDPVKTVCLELNFE